VIHERAGAIPRSGSTIAALRRESCDPAISARVTRIIVFSRHGFRAHRAAARWNSRLQELLAKLRHPIRPEPF
jgi:hypothetical protein